MTITLPRPGEVIRYAYLWSDEAADGLEEGVKQRPCAVVMSAKSAEGKVTLIVLPVTHSAPRGAVEALELPPLVKRHLGLDDERSWIVLTEANRFVWPGPDIRPFESDGQTIVSYGYLPPRFFAVLTERYLQLDTERKIRSVRRTE